MRAARTDKGVSAVGQLVSLKMLVEFPNYDIVASINKHLPDQIRVLGYTKVTAGFDARKHCDKRRYEYVLPAWAFDPKACRSSISTKEVEAGAHAQPQTASDANTSAAPSSEAAPTAPVPSTVPCAHKPAATDALAEATAVAVASEATLPSIPGSSDTAKQPGASQHQSDAIAAVKPQIRAAGSSASAPYASPPSKPAAADSSHLASGRATGTAAAQTAAPAEAAPAETAGAGAASEAAPSPPAPSNSTAAAAEAVKPSNAFTFNKAAVAKLNSILKLYEGTHNFHNFTVRLEASDPSAKRYMLSCKCDGVFQIQVRPWLI